MLAGRLTGSALAFAAYPSDGGQIVSSTAFVLVSTSDRYDHEWEREALSAIDGFAFDLRSAMPQTPEEMIIAAQGADAILLSSREPMTKEIMQAIPTCKVIARYAVGLDNIDLNAAADLGIVVTHYPMYCTNEVADHALALLLALNRRVVQLDRDLHAGIWVRETHHMDRMLRGPIPALRESTIGVVGVGRIGSAVIERLRPFGATILAADPHVDPAEIVRAGARPVSLEALMSTSDIVTLHCPLTAETHGMIDARALGLMKPGALLVNTARGPIVDLAALVAALESGRIGGAALDVVYPEPLPLESPLYGLSNVILTPHSAYYSERSVEVIRHETLRAAVDVLQGMLPKVVANPTVLERVTLRPRS